MADDFLAEARADWRRQDTEVGQLRKRLSRNRWLPHALLCVELMGAAAAILIGLWFFWVAITAHDPLFALCAAAMLSAMPATMVGNILARWDSLRWEDETPVSVLRVGLRRAEASLWSIRLGWCGVAVNGGFGVVLWITLAAGLIDAREFVMLYSLLSAAILAPYVVWLAWRRRRVLAERAAYLGLLDDFQAADGAKEP